MRRFGALGLRLNRVGDAALPNVLHFIALLLAIPCFKLAYALGEVAFLGNQRKLRLLGLDKQAHQFGLERLNLARVTNVHEGL